VEKGKWWKEIQEKTGKLNTYSSVRRWVLHEKGCNACRRLEGNALVCWHHKTRKRLWPLPFFSYTLSPLFIISFFHKLYIYGRMEKMNNITGKFFKLQMICRRQKINTSQITLMIVQIKTHIPKIIVVTWTDEEIW
jgi:hypothetical protein